IGVHRSFAGVSVSNGGFSKIGIMPIASAKSRLSNARFHRNAADGELRLVWAATAGVAEADRLVADRVGAFREVFHFGDRSERLDGAVAHYLALGLGLGIEQTAI